MTEEEMEGHGPHRHSYVWDAHIKGKGKAVLLAMYTGGRVVHENGKKVMAFCVRSHWKEIDGTSEIVQGVNIRMKKKKIVIQMIFRCFGAHLMGCGWRIEDNERE